MIEKKSSEEDYQLVFGGRSKDRVELDQIRTLLEQFIEKHGGQYVCAVIRPEESETKKEKGKVPLGSSNVTIFSSFPSKAALKALWHGEVMWVSGKGERRRAKAETRRGG
jgi:hypothetical protein